MQLVRKILLVLLAPLFVLLLFVTALDVGFLRVATHPATVENIISGSNVYNSVVPGLLQEGGQITAGGGSVSLTNPTVEMAAEKTFSPQFIQSNANAVINSIYKWLDGSTPLPDFQIDLTSQKAEFASNVAQAVQTKLTGMPVCTSASAADSFDPLSATCLPKGITAAEAASSLQDEIITGRGFLDNPVLTADSVKSGNSGQSIFANQLKDAPKQYQKIKKTPVTLALLTAVIGLAIIFLSASLPKGLRRVGIPLVVIGLLMLIFGWGLNRGVSHNLAPKINVNNTVLQDSLRTLAVDVANPIAKNYMWFGVGYAVAGALAIGGSVFLGRRSSGPKPMDDMHGEGQTPDDKIDLREKDTLTPLATPRPAPKKKIIIQ